MLQVKLFNIIIIIALTFLQTLFSLPTESKTIFLNGQLHAASLPISNNYEEPSYYNQYSFDPYEMLYYVNQERREVGSPPLRLNNKLSRAAQEHSEWQANVGRMSHTGVYGTSPFERIRHAGYRSNGEAENVAYNQRSVREVMRSWINSPGHYRNIVDPRFTELGVGMEDYYWTQTFGSGDYD